MGRRGMPLLNLAKMVELEDGRWYLALVAFQPGSLSFFRSRLRWLAFWLRAIGRWREGRPHGSRRRHTSPADTPHSAMFRPPLFAFAYTDYYSSTMHL